MADTIPPPPPHPPKGPTSRPGSEEWFQVEENKTKHKNFGASLGFVAEEKIRNFVFEMSFASKTDEAATTINIYNPHKAFITKLLEITEGDTHVMPTAKGRDDNIDAISSTKSPIISADAFPKTTYQHGQFFERKIYYNQKTNRTVVKITHQVLMKEPIHVVKKKMLDFLQTNRIWLKNGDLDSIETSGFGCFFAAHDSMVFRPALKDTLIKLIQALPQTIIQNAIKEYGTPDDATKLPDIFLNPKWQAFGNHPKRVQTHAVTISCVNNKIRLMKELICLIPKESMPFQFIHIGLATTNHPDTYWKSIVANNDNQNAVQGITVKGFSKELFSKHMKNKANVMASVATHFLNFRSILSIEETHKTQESGRYIFIVKKNDFPAAQAFISEFCSTVFQTLYPTEEAQGDYRVMYQHHPHLVASPSAGGAVGANGDYLVEMLSKVEIARGQPFSIHTSYAEKTAPRIVIEHETAFPALPDNKKNHQEYLHINETNSIATNNSDSTRAATKTGATSSGQTFASQEVSLAISEMKSIMSNMFDRQEKYMRQAAQEAKDAAREAKQEAKEAAAEAKREANQLAIDARKETAEATTRMQNFLVNMMEMLIAANPQPKHKQANATRRPTTLEQRQLSPMWQASRRNESAEPMNLDPIYTDDYIDNTSQCTNEYGNPNDYEDNDDYQEDAENNDNAHEDCEDEAGEYNDPYAENETDLRTHSESQIQSKQLKSTPPANPTDHKITDTVFKSHKTQTPPKITNARATDKPRSRVRSPGTSPHDGQKLQRTGKAPTKPSTQENTAQALDFEGMQSHSTIPEAPDPKTQLSNRQ